MTIDSTFIDICNLDSNMFTRALNMNVAGTKSVEHSEPLANILALLTPCHNTSIPISGDGAMDAFKVALGIIVMLFGLMGFLLIFVSPVFADLALPLDILYFPYAFCLVCELIGVYLLREGLRTDSL